MELILTGKTIDATKAQEIGLVNEIIEPEQLMLTALEWAKTIAAQAQVAVQQSKQCIHRGAQTDITTAVTYKSQAFGMCFGTLEQKEGMTAFVEKRKESISRANRECSLSICDIGKKRELKKNVGEPLKYSVVTAK